MSEFMFEAPNGILYPFEIEGDVPTEEELLGISQILEQNHTTRDTPEEFLTPDAQAAPRSSLASPTTKVIGSGPRGSDGQAGVTVTVDQLNDSFLSREERQQVIDETRAVYESDPTYNDSLFGSSVRGADNVPYRIPSMNVGPDGDVDINNSVITEGVRDGVKHLVTLGGDVVDGVRSLAGAEPKNYGQQVVEGMSEFKEERMLQGLGKEASGMLSPGGAGAKIAGYVADVAKLGPKVTALVKGFGMSLGTTAGTNANNSSTVFTGDNALIPVEIIEKNFGVDPTDPKYVQRMQTRTNILLEEGVVGVALQGTVKGGLFLAKFTASIPFGMISNLLGLNSLSKTQLLAVEEINDRLMAAQATFDKDGAASEGYEATLRNLADSIEKHAQTVIDIDDPLLDSLAFDESTMNALIKAVNSGDINLVEETVVKARQIQQGAILKDGATARAAGQSRVATEDALTSVDQRLGGTDAVDAATDSIQTKALGDIDAADTAAFDLDVQVKQAAAELELAIKEDPLIGESLDALGNKTGVEFRAENSTGALRGMADRVIESYRVLKGQRNEVYGGVEGGDLDSDALFEFLRGAKPAQLDAARNSLGRTNQLATIFDIIDPSRTKSIDVTDAKGKVSTQTTPMSDEELMEEFNAALEAAGIVDYGTMFSKLRGPMAALKSELFDNADTAAKGAGRELDELIKFIDGKLLDGTGDDELIDAVAAAKAWDQENFIPYFRDTPQLAEIARVFDERIASSSTGTGVRSNANFTPIRQEAVNQIGQSLSEDAALYGQKVIQLLRTEAGGESADDVVSFFINEAMRPLQNSIRMKGTPSDEAILEAVNSLQQYASLIVDEFPEAAKRIRVLEDNLLSGGSKSRMLGASLDEATLAAERVRERVFNVQLNEFFGANGLPVENAQRAWTALLTNFSSANDVGRFRNLVDAALASGDEIVIDGMRAAVIKQVKQKFVTNGKTASGTPAMSLSQIAKDSQTGDGHERLLEALQAVFKGRENVAEGIIDLLARSGDEQALATRSAVIAGSDTVVKKEQLAALNSIVTAAFGVLSRRGAVIRAGATRIINKTNQTEKYNDAVDFVLANPKLYANLTRQIADQKFGKATGIRSYLNAMYDPAIAALVKAGMVSEKEANEMLESPDRLIEAAELEAALTEGVQDARDGAGGFIRTIGDQMKSLFD